MANERKDSYVIMNIMARLTYGLHVYFEYNVENKQILYNQN